VEVVRRTTRDSASSRSSTRT